MRSRKAEPPASELLSCSSEHCHRRDGPRASSFGTPQGDFGDRFANPLGSRSVARPQLPLHLRKPQRTNRQQQQFRRELDRLHHGRHPTSGRNLTSGQVHPDPPDASEPHRGNAAPEPIERKGSGSGLRALYCDPDSNQSRARPGGDKSPLSDGSGIPLHELVRKLVSAGQGVIASSKRTTGKARLFSAHSMRSPRAAMTVATRPQAESRPPLVVAVAARAPLEKAEAVAHPQAAVRPTKPAARRAPQVQGGHRRPLATAG
jgi:hypothetical protein